MGEIIRPEAAEIKENIIEVESDFKDENEQPYKIKVDTESPGAFYFDVDGTLVDLKQIHHDSLFLGFQKYFPNDERFQNPTAEFKKEFDDAHFAKFGVPLDEVCENICKRFSIEKGNVSFKDIEAEYSSKFLVSLDKLEPEEIEEKRIKGAKILLENLQRNNWPMAVVTANDSPRAFATLKKFGLGKYFVTGAFNDHVPAERDPDVPGRAYILWAAKQHLKEKFKDQPNFEKLPFINAKGMVIGDTVKDFTSTVPYEEKTDYSILVDTGGRGLDALDSAHKGELRPDLVVPQLHITGLKMTGHKEADKQNIQAYIKRLKLTNYTPPEEVKN